MQPMRPSWPLLAILTVLLVLASAITVSSRVWMLSTHRDLAQERRKYSDRLDQEHALQVELASRSDMNTIERRARQALGMRSLHPDQWRVLPP